MKDHEWCEMDDEMDPYLGRCIKNWAAQYQPPADGHVRLIEAAMSHPVQNGRRLMHVLALLSSVFQSRAMVNPHNEWQRGPYSQSRPWSLYFATNYRLAN